MPETNTPESQELEVTPVEGGGPVPVGWWLLFGGLIAFGGWYLWAYTPELGGWSQAGELLRPGGAGDGAGGSILATVLFTALAAVTAAVLLFTLSRRKAR